MRQPRPFQLEQFEAVRAAFSAKKKCVMIEAPTGTGKTVSFVLMAKMTLAKKGRVLILVNRDVLVSQTLAELGANGLFSHREQAEQRAPLTADVVVASIQSLGGKWLDRWPKDFFKLVILDEAHGSAAATFKRILDHFGTAYHCGFTATPERHDKRGLWKGYTDIVHSFSLTQAIDDGWLCNFQFRDLDVPVTLDEKLMKHANFAEGEEVFDSKKYLAKIADEVATLSQGHKSLNFLPNCRVSLEFATMLKGLGVNAEHIDSSYMTPARTTELLEWFHDQKEAVLCNAQLLTTGFNEPAITQIGMFRPVSSTSLYKQMLGRGTRPVARIDDYLTAEERKQAIATSAKPHCSVLQLFFENGSHDLASPSCLITDDAKEREELDKTRKAGQQVDFGKLEEQLKAKRMADTAEEVRKYAEVAANSQHKKKRSGIYIADILKQYKSTHKPASEAFVKYVRKMGADIPEGKYSAYQIMRIKERIQKAA